MTVLVVASLSVAEAVMPTSVPFVAFSTTLFAVVSASTGVDTDDSFKSLIPIVTVSDVNEVSLLVARMAMSNDAATSRSIAPATVTTPVFASIANRPPALLVSEYVTTSVPSGSLADAVMPTVVPIAEFSATVLLVASLSITALTPPSLMSVIVTLMV